MRASLVLVALAFAAGKVYFEDGFDSADFEKKWVNSEVKKGEMGTWVWTSGKWAADEKVNKGIATSEDMKHHSISAKLPETVTSKGKELVLQFTAKVEEHKYAFCGGGYIKLLPPGLDQKNFGGDSEYNIMFGPDLCGYDTSLIHTIFTYKGKNLLKTDKINLEYDEKNEFTHLYTLHLKPDDTFEVFFDKKSKASGKLVDGWDFPKPTMDDPEDSKPSDWVDEQMIDDPEDKKPAGYDDIPKDILDPEATKPEDWDDDDDGEWEAPLIPNPDFKGDWTAKRIDNPAYKGEWSPKQVANPDFVEGTQLGAFDSGYVGFELWTVNNGTIFDNILVCDDIDYAFKQADKLWKPTSEKEKAIKEEWDKVNKPDDAAPAGDDDEPEDEEEEDIEKDEL